MAFRTDIPLVSSADSDLIWSANKATKLVISPKPCRITCCAGVLVYAGFVYDLMVLLFFHLAPTICPTRPVKFAFMRLRIPIEKTPCPCRAVNILALPYGMG